MEGEDPQLRPLNNLNPRRRPYSQAGIDGNLSGEIVDLYSVPDRRSIDEALLSINPQIDSDVSSNPIPDGTILQSSQVRDIPSITQSGQINDSSTINHTSHPAGIVNKVAAKQTTPLSWEEEDDSFFSRYWINITTFMGLGLVLTSILTFLVWPRGVKVTVKEIKSIGTEEHTLFIMDGKLGVLVEDNLETIVENNNFLPIRIRKATVQGFWLLPDQSAFGNGTIEKVSLGPKRSKTLQLPYKVDYLGDPNTDPIYQDFFLRCAQSGGERRGIDMEYLVTIDLSYMGIKFQRQVDYAYQVPCPVTLSPVNIGKVLETSGFDPAKITVKALGNVSLKSLIGTADGDNGDDKGTTDQKESGKS